MQSRPVKILHVHSGNLFGGVETMLLNFARSTKYAPEMQHSFALCYAGRLADELRQNAAEVFNLPPTRLSHPLGIIRARRALKDVLRREKFDVLALHSAWAQVIFGAVANSPQHLSALFLHAPFDRRRWLEKRARYHHPAIIIANSEFTARSVNGLFAGVEPKVVYPPVEPRAKSDVAIREAVRQAHGVAVDDALIVQVSRMEAGKGHQVLLSALREISPNPRWRCWIIGGAQRADEIQYSVHLIDLIKQYGLESRVQMLGESREVSNLLSAADIFCQPNTEPEGFGITLVEAANHGLPIVTSRLGAPPEFLDADNSILTPPDDVAAVANALQQLVRDAELRSKLGANAQHNVALLTTPKTQIQCLAAVFAESVSAFENQRDAVAA